jgi:hypothetical protein
MIVESCSFLWSRQVFADVDVNGPWRVEYTVQASMTAFLGSSFRALLLCVQWAVQRRRMRRDLGVTGPTHDCLIACFGWFVTTRHAAVFRDDSMLGQRTLMKKQARTILITSDEPRITFSVLIIVKSLLVKKLYAMVQSLLDNSAGSF